ncbi:MFS transporter [Simiduia aestuariiviva]|uniref:Fucose permease n=1 Tax=Simiduia aestuariiviva TaxID=1510459 RepID=A0A839UGG5_9GAMM|nr:MFS transporter [Simiduia aestuariiviva]MBB3166982.1 fucose permease [Simiduia aestuariiviva]
MTRIWLFLTYIIFAILLNSVGTVILQVQNSFSVVPSEAAVLEAYKDLSIALTSFLIASFLARLGYRRSVMLALAAMAVTCLAVPALPHFWMTKVLFLMTGISFAVIKVAVFSSLGLIAKDQKAHVSTMNYLEAFFMFGVMGGYFIFSAFVSPQDPGDLQWLNVYYLLAGLCALALVLTMFVDLDESELRHSAKPLTKEFSGMISLSFQPLVVVFVMSVFLYVLVEQAIMSWLPSYNSQVLNLTPALGIQMASILAASTAMGRLLAGWVFRKYHWYPVLNTALVLAGVLILLALPLAAGTSSEPIAAWSQAPVAAYVFPMIGLCLAPVYPAINSVVLSALPVRQHAPMSGLIVVFSALGGTLGSLITGRLFEWVGGAQAFYGALLPLAAILLALYGLRHYVDANVSQQRRADHSGAAL